MPTELRTGAVVAGFRVQSLLGEGATGSVYLAEDGSGRRVALKLLSPELSRDERFRRRFLRETEVAAGLDHPHAVRTVASGEADGVLYLAMAYVEGSDLREVKPANILVAPDATGERRYLRDCGLARHVSSVGSLTGDRGFVGTVD